MADDSAGARPDDDATKAASRDAAAQDAAAAEPAEAAADAAAASDAAADAGAAAAEAGAESGAPESDDAAPDAKDHEIAALSQELAAMKDKWMRSVADLQNLRKRADKERSDAERYGGQKLARDLLAVYDNLDMALAQASEALQENEPGFFNGVALTKKELLNAFSKHKIQLVAPDVGERFDPNKHQAVFEAPAPEGVEAGSVVQVMQAGFMIADRLLRPAMVGVAAAGGEAPAAADG